MLVKSVFVKEVSQQIKILQAESKKEVSGELVKLQTDISELSYKSWVIDTFIPGVSQVFSHLIEKSEGRSSDINKLKDILYYEVLKLNPLLDPEEIYISPSNVLTTTKEKVKLVACSTWKIAEDTSSLMVLNVTDSHKIVENIKSLDHYIETEDWELFDKMLVCVRKFKRDLKTSLLHGLDPQTEDEVKYFVVLICIDNFQQVYEYLEQNIAIQAIHVHKIISSLFDIAIRHNPFLDVKIKDFKKINKHYRMFKEGVVDEEDAPALEKSARKTLASVPKKEILNLEDNVRKVIFGQEQAIKDTCNAIKRAYLGIKNPKTPIGAFFYYGSTSTGKTELAKELARLLTKSSSGLVKVSCNTLTDSHNVHTLLGSPPGYVGYEEKGLLESALQHSKFKVILFDEAEKAHKKLNDIVLEMLEEGQILLANGSYLDVSNCLIIFTSNVGQEEANKASNMTGFRSETTSTEDREKAEIAAFETSFKERYKPEFISRLNGIFYFKKLNEEQLLKSANSYLLSQSKNLIKRKIRLTYPKNLGGLIIDKCKAKKLTFHARDVRNFIDMDIMQKLGDFVIELNLNDKIENSININIENEEINFSLSPIKESKPVKVRKQYKKVIKVSK